MNTKIQSHLSTYHASSKIWIYTSSRPFSTEEQRELEQTLAEFSHNWTSHGAKVIGQGLLLEDRFILFVADEVASGVSGCSIDKTMALIRMIADRYQVNLLDRFLISYRENERIHSCSLAEFKNKIASKAFSEETILFDNTITSLAAMSLWERPYNQSPYAKIEAPISFSL